MAENAKPLPQISPLTQPFWEATASKRLIIQRCNNCEVFIWCPHPACTECGSEKLEWTPVSGKGTVFSFTIIRHVLERRGRGFENDVPYIVAWIDLDEGPRFCSNVVNCPVDEIKIGMPVEVAFEETGGGFYLPKFRPLLQS